jgi:type II secretory pathway predicted ATPase ExeA
MLQEAMYKSFFHLKINPFASSPDPRFLYMMPHTREALATLEYGISAHKGFIVLTGEVGTGKTTLLRRALASLDQSRVSCSIHDSTYWTSWNLSFQILGLLLRTGPSPAC